MYHVCAVCFLFLEKFLHENWTRSLLEYYVFFFFFCVEQFSEQFGEEIGFFVSIVLIILAGIWLCFVKAHWNINNKWRQPPL
jgi:hypothetical protein